MIHDILMESRALSSSVYSVDRTIDVWLYANASFGGHDSILEDAVSFLSFTERAEPLSSDPGLKSLDQQSC